MMNLELEVKAAASGGDGLPFPEAIKGWGANYRLTEPLPSEVHSNVKAEFVKGSRDYSQKALVSSSLSSAERSLAGARPRDPGYPAVREAQQEAQRHPSVNFPRFRRSYCKRCGRHQLHRVTQYRRGKDSPVSQGTRRYLRKQRGYGGQTKPVFRKKAKTTKKVVLRLECMVPNCRCKRLLAIKRCKHFEVGGVKKVKGQMIQF
ncbi:60S ribosomal protein L36a [Antechinus flavipes]|uniref:60S ribosomal protein L36a n=1 Tax=Antechinus flavipes TaxID=38775 RepID=UPI0022355235|nr:60S ribosomal protein L36a [Antechinus flavipes]